MTATNKPNRFLNQEQNPLVSIHRAKIICQTEHVLVSQPKVSKRSLLPLCVTLRKQAPLFSRAPGPSTWWGAGWNSQGSFPDSLPVSFPVGAAKLQNCTPTTHISKEAGKF